MLEDVLAPDLALVICGTAAGKTSGEIKQYDAGQGNKLWRTLWEVGLATLASANVVAVLNGWPVWPAAEGVEDVLPFLESPDPPHAAPSIVTADELGLTRWVG